MNPLMPYFVEAGCGPGIVCLHANASSSSQWRALMDRLAPRHRVLAADGYGAGKSPEWPGDRRISLREEVAFLAPVFVRAGQPCTLVGHSYGGAVAMIAALHAPQRVRAVAVYEPTLFGLLDAERAPPNDADGIREVIARAAPLVAAGYPHAAAECFIDYWMGTDTWASMADARRTRIAASIGNIGRWGEALLSEPARIEAFRALPVPVLLMVGTKSPPSSRGVARLLAAALPQVTLVEFDGLGHMGPVTHPEVVNEAIAAFIEELAASSSRASPRIDVERAESPREHGFVAHPALAGS